MKKGGYAVNGVKRSKVLLVVTMLLLFLGGEAGTASELTSIQFILDASLSMMSRIQGETRMEIAKDVMRELLLDLEDRPDLEIALRVYGSGLTELFGCRDSVLFQDFAPVNEARDNILAIVDSLEPRGVTPIAYSLMLAGDDFAARPGGQNVIVLVTDGQESCQGDPCAVSQQLQQQGIIMKPFVVGFALPEREAEFVRCIGHYYEADDRASLQDALQDILTAVTLPPVLELAVWAQGEAVTDKVQVRLVDGTGAAAEISHLVNAVPWARVAGLAEGPYTLEVVLQHGPETLAAASEPFTLTAGETTRVEVDFGALLGRLTVIAGAGGVDVSDAIQLTLTQQGAAVSASWQGVPPQTSIPAGLYDVAAVLDSDPQRTAQTRTWVAVDTETVVHLELGQLPAQLWVDVVYGGEDISSRVGIDIHRDGRWQQSWTGGRQDPIPPGTITLGIRYQGDVVIEKMVDNVALVAGETTHVVVDLGTVMGTLQVALEAAGTDVTAQGSVQVTGTNTAGEAYAVQLPQRGAYKETVLPAGSVVALGLYQNSRSQPTGIVVAPGEITQAVLEIPTRGQVRLLPTVGNLLAGADQIEAHLWQDERYVAQLAPEDPGFAMAVDPGEYRLEVMVLTAPVQTQTMSGIQVRSGEETVVEMEFAGAGGIQLAAFSGDEPMAQIQRVEVQQGGEVIMRLSRENRDSHLWEGQLLAGVYDVRVVPNAILRLDDIWLPAVEVLAAEVTVLTAQFAGIGRILLQVFMEGAPYDGANTPRVYEAGAESSLVQLHREGDRSEGLWARDMAVGSYDIAIDPGIRGMESLWLRNVTVVHGETTEVEAHFGASGTLQVQVLADGEPFSDVSAPRVFLPGATSQLAQLHRVGARDDALWSRELPAGLYDLRVSSNVRGMDDIVVTGITVRPGVTEEIVVEFERAGALQLLLLSDGEPFLDASTPRVFPVGESRQLAQLQRVGARENALWARDLPAGSYDVRIASNVRGMEEIVLEGITLPSGTTVEMVVEFPGYGTLQLQVRRGGQPLPEISGVDVFVPGESRALTNLARAGARADSLWERDLPVGTYDVEVRTQNHGVHWLRGVVVSSRQLTALTADIP